MFSQPPSLICKFACGFAVGICLAFADGGNAAEPAVATNSVAKSETVSSDAQKQPSKFFRAYRPGETISGSDIFKPNAPITPPRQNPPSSTKRDEDLIDRQKNWIFLSRDEKKPDATKEVLGVEDLSFEGRKGAIARFLENKPESDLKTNVGAKNEINPGLTSQPLNSGLTSGLSEETQNDPRRSSSLQPQPLERNLDGNDAERARFSDLWRERYGINSSQAREDKEAEAKAFRDLFSPRSAATPGTGLTTLTGQNNFGVKLVTPDERGSTRPSNPNEFTSSLDPFKEAPRRPVGGSSILTEPSFTSRAFGPTAAPVLKTEAAKSVSQPAVLPFPKRRF